MSSRVYRVLALAVLSCGGGCDSRATGPPALASVSVSPPAVTLVAGTTSQLSAALADAAGNALVGRTVIWSSSARGVASVSPAGLVTGVLAGSATITAVAAWKTGSAAVTVLPPVALVTVAPNAARIAPGNTRQFTATLTDASGNTLTGRTVAWSTSNASAAAVNGSSGVATGVAEGVATITATAEGKTGSAALTVTVEPPGMTLIAERPFNCVKLTACETDWGYTEFGNGSEMTSVQDPTAPKSPPNVAQVTFPPGWPGGSGVAQAEHSLHSYNTIYVSAWIKFSANWDGNPTGNNKMLYFFKNGFSSMVTEAYGSGTGSLDPVVCPLGLAAPLPANLWPGDAPAISLCLRANLNTSRPVVRGQWHRFEYVLVDNVPGVADGSFEAWLDGTRLQSVTQIMWEPAGGRPGWKTIQWAPIWGGGAGTVVSTMFQQIDHIYISGK